MRVDTPESGGPTESGFASALTVWFCPCWLFDFKTLPRKHPQGDCFADCTSDFERTHQLRPISLEEGSSVVALPASERHAYRQRKWGHRGQLLTRSRSLFRAARRASADATMPICTKEAEFSGPYSEDSTYNGGSQMPHFKETTLSELPPPKMLEESQMPRSAPLLQLSSKLRCTLKSLCCNKNPPVPSSKGSVV